MLILKAGLLLDGTGDGPRKNATLLINQGKIIDIVEFQDALIDENALFYDASDFTVMPGMTDAHVHVMYSGKPNDLMDGCQGFVSELPGMAALKAYTNAMKHVEAGFTTIRDMSSREFIDISLRDAINNDVVVGPTVKACGYGLTSTGGHMDYYKGLRPDVLLSYYDNRVDTPEQGRTAVRYLVMMGVDHIKINTASCYRIKDRPLIHAKEMRNDVVTAIIEEAHTLGRTVSAHCDGTDEVFAIKAGIDSLEHGHFLNDDTIKAMADYGTFLIPTMTHCVRNTNDIKEKLPKEKWSDNLILNAYDSMYRVLPRAYELGVRIGVGTDSGANLVPHGSNALEIELLTTIGMDPMQAIIASCQTNADLFGDGELIGSLEKGKIADILVVNGNPLNEIKILQNQGNILTVFKKGQIVVDRR